MTQYYILLLFYWKPPSLKSVKSFQMLLIIGYDLILGYIAGRPSTVCIDIKYHIWAASPHAKAKVHLIYPVSVWWSLCWVGMYGCKMDTNGCLARRCELAKWENITPCDVTSRTSNMSTIFWFSAIDIYLSSGCDKNCGCVASVKHWIKTATITSFGHTDTVISI